MSVWTLYKNIQCALLTKRKYIKMHIQSGKWKVEIKAVLDQRKNDLISKQNALNLYKNKG